MKPVFIVKHDEIDIFEVSAEEIIIECHDGRKFNFSTEDHTMQVTTKGVVIIPTRS